MKIFQKNTGLTLVETVVAVSVFLIFIFVGNILLKFFAGGVIDIERMFQSSFLAKNGTIIVENILQNEESNIFDRDYLTFIGTPKKGYFQLRWEGEWNELKLAESELATLDASLETIFQQMQKRYEVSESLVDFQALALVDKKAQLRTMFKNYTRYHILPNIYYIAYNTTDNTELDNIFQYLDVRFVLSETLADFQALSVSAKQDYLSAAWTTEQSAYLGSDQEYEGPFTVYSEYSPARFTTRFYRKFIVEEKESWGLYEIEGDVCYEDCDNHVKVYKTFNR